MILSLVGPEPYQTKEIHELTHRKSLEEDEVISFIHGRNDIKIDETIGKNKSKKDFTDDAEVEVLNP